MRPYGVGAPTRASLPLRAGPLAREVLMRRREVIAGLGASAFTGALAARAQQPARAHRMAIAHPAAATSNMTQGKLARMLL